MSLKTKVIPQGRPRNRLVYAGIFLNKDKKVAHLYFEAPEGTDLTTWPTDRFALHADESEVRAKPASFSKPFRYSCIGRVLTVEHDPAEPGTHFPATAKHLDEWVPNRVRDAWEAASDNAQALRTMDAQAAKMAGKSRLQDMLQRPAELYNACHTGRDRAAFLARCIAVITGDW